MNTRLRGDEIDLRSSVSVRKIKVAAEFPHRATSLVLAQIESEIDRDTKRITMPGHNWAQIRGALSHLGKTPSPRILVLPEVAVPRSNLTDYLAAIEDLPGGPTITIAGLEIAPATEYLAVLDSLETDRRSRQETQRLLEMAADRPVNACLIDIQFPEVSERHLQLKLSPSKYEGALDALRDLVRGTTLPIFELEGLTFAVVICSDLINPPDGKQERIMRDVEDAIYREKVKLDLLINIQHNPSPDHKEFTRPIARLFDERSEDWSRIGVVFLNSTGTWGGGASKMLFSSECAIPDLPKIKHMAAPTKGYDLGAGARLTTVTLSHLPRFWRRKPPDPISMSICSWGRGGWTRDDEESRNVSFVTEFEHVEALKPQTRESVATSFSKQGMFRQAIAELERALEAHRKDPVAGARCLHHIGNQYRHLGEMLKASEAYTKGMRLLDGHHNEPGAKERLWRLQAAWIMTHRYLVAGQCRGAREDNVALLKKVKEHIRVSRARGSDLGHLETYVLHGQRQIAELDRYLGRYSTAGKTFANLTKAYGWIHPDEAAYARLGYAESLRMTGEYSDAAEIYLGLRTLTYATDNARLRGRVLKGLAELSRASVKRLRDLDKPERYVDELQELSHETGYLFGQIYALLCRGGVLLDAKAPEDARLIFEDALACASDESKGPFEIERSHAMLGIAESLRLGRDPGAAGKFADAAAAYRRTAVYWGRARSAMGLVLTGKRRSLDLFARSEDPLDKQLVAAIAKHRLGRSRSLFRNMP